MAEGKRKFIEDAAKVIDGRVAVLKAELERDQAIDPNATSMIGDRAAIAEAELCARMIRTLALRPYCGAPYDTAFKRWMKGEAE